MTSSEFRARLGARAEKAGVSLSADAQHQLETYFRLLAKWNETMNLTALPLGPPTDETFDRLLIEPVAAAAHAADSAQNWFDIGSGGGSPAIPFKIARPRARLTMIEAKERKAAFLREAIRTVGLVDAIVENDRFESVAAAASRRSVDLVTVRAVRSDLPLFAAVHRLLSPAGRAFFFHSPAADLPVPVGFITVEVASLGSGRDSRLTILKASPAEGMPE